MFLFCPSYRRYSIMNQFKYTDEETRIAKRYRTAKKHRERLEWVAFATKQVFPKWNPETIETIFHGYLTRQGFRITPCT